jgi:hypothetical protein
MTPDKAFAILEEMRNDGQVDAIILEMFRVSKAWERDDDGKVAELVAAGVD